MVIIRPVTIKDLDPLLGLAAQAGVGLTTLPNDADVLRRRILKSQRSMENISDRPGGESYMFVMEEMESRTVIGISGIVSKVGGFEPFYGYRLETQIFQWQPLKIRKEIKILHLVREHDGPAEVGSLFLSPNYRKKDYGRFLQLVRFLFVAEHREAFEPMVVSELRGVIDENGDSAFWNAVGKHFFEIGFPQADHLSVVNKKFIADLMPQYPIYVPLLPAEAQRVIGLVHESSKPALKNLQGEGFRFNGMVDIFDAGACVACARDEIRAVRDSQIANVEEIRDDEKIDSPTHMVCVHGGEFRASIGSARITSGRGVALTKSLAVALRLKKGDVVRSALLRPAPQLVTPPERESD